MKNTSTAPPITATRPAVYAHWSPWRNAVFAPEMIASAYWGCCSATSSAPAKDFVSCACVESVTFLSEAAMAAPAAAA